MIDPMIQDLNRYLDEQDEWERINNYAEEYGLSFEDAAAEIEERMTEAAIARCEDDQYYADFFGR